MKPIHHSIDYIELAASDLAASKAFYENVFGWTFTDYGPEYAAIKSPDGEGEVGGISTGLRPGSGAPLVLLYSDDLEATLPAIEAAGGRVSAPPFPFPGGRRFHFIDPGSNELGVWTSA